MSRCPVGSLASLAVFAALAAGAAEGAERPGFVDGGKFVVCTDPSFPPMEYFAKSGDTEPVGFDVDLMRQLADAWQVSLEILPMDFAGLLPSLEARRCDAVISGMFVTEERKQKFDAVSYLDTVSVLAAKAGTPRIGSVEELAGRNVAVQAGTSFVQMFEKINAQLAAKGLSPVEVQLYPKASDCIQQVLIGRAFAATTQDTELAYRELQNPGALASAYEFADPQSFGVFIRKAGDDIDAVFSTMSERDHKGALAAAAREWRLDPGKIAVRR